MTQNVTCIFHTRFDASMPIEMPISLKVIRAQGPVLKNSCTRGLQKQGTCVCISGNNYGTSLTEKIKVYQIRLLVSFDIKLTYHDKSYFIIYKYLQNFILLPNLVAFSCYTVNIHLEKWLVRCDTNRAIWWDLYNKHIMIFCIKHMSFNFFARCRWTNDSWKNKRFCPLAR